MKVDPLTMLLKLLEPTEGLRPRARRRRVKEIGEYLAILIDRKRGPFTVEYFDNVVRGKMNIGEPLARALRAEYLSRDGRCAIYGSFSPAEVRTRGNVESGALILASSRRCRYCNVAFVPKSGNQSSCSAICRRKYYKNGRE